MKWVLLFLLCFSKIATIAQTDTSLINYNLFRPVPKALMREMATDRPDVTESAYTLDAGHFQVETDLLKTSNTINKGIKETARFYNLANLKLGLGPSTDLQLVINTYSKFRTEANENTGDFFNDATLRIKHNIWGNNSGKTALSVMPYVNIPLKDNGIEGGVIFPFAAELGSKWGFGAQAEFDIIKNEIGDGHHIEMLNSVTFNREILRKLEGFAESYYNLSFESKSFSLYGNTGLIYSLTNNFNLDTGINYGITKDAAKVFFVGLSFRY